MRGLDLGSRFIKQAEYGRNKKLKLDLADSLSFFEHFDERLKALEDKQMVCTGYGRHTLKLPGLRTIPEIQAHVLGASRITGLKDFTLLDIGGQDTKVALVRKGRIQSFLTNDKCAASSGRFLENMTRILGFSLDQLLSFYKDPLPLSATCAIFAESEVIGMMVNKVPGEQIAASVNYALFQRIRPWLDECYSASFVLSGGVAGALCLHEFIREVYPDSSVLTPENAHFLGAIGCLVKCEKS